MTIAPHRSYSTAMLFSMQEELIEQYWEIENLPKPPLSLFRKHDQRVMRELTFRVIEELYEMAWATDDSAAGEEFCDALHFYIELLVYASVSHIALDRVLTDLETGVTIDDLVMSAVQSVRSLKFKPWKKAQPEFSRPQYVEALLILGCRLFSYALQRGWTFSMIDATFKVTWQKNQHRLNTGY